MKTSLIGAIVFGILFLTALLPVDFATSVVPGWHTTALAPFQIIGIILFLLIVLVAFAYFILFGRHVIVPRKILIIQLLLSIPGLIIYFDPFLPFRFYELTEADYWKLRVHTIFNFTVLGMFIIVQILFLVYAIRRLIKIKTALQ